MGPKDVIQHTLAINERIVNSYLNDLSDADLLVVPVQGMHPIAMQLGHLIGTERWFVDLLAPGTAPALPEGFIEHHDIKNPPADSSGYLTKAAYIEHWNAQRGAIKSVLETVSDDELDDTRDGKLPAFAPTVGAILNLAGCHWLMHIGQFVAVRRQLEKPIAF